MPDPALSSPEVAAFDHRLFRRNASVLGYRGVIYEVAGSSYHDFLDPLLRDHPGIVSLHDANDPRRTRLALEHARAVVVRPDVPLPELAAVYAELIERVHAGRPAVDSLATSRFRVDAPEAPAPFRPRPQWSQTS